MAILVFSRTRCGPGWVLTGFSPEVEAMPRRFSSEVVSLPQDSKVLRWDEVGMKVSSMTKEVAGRRPWKPFGERRAISREYERHPRGSPCNGSLLGREDAARARKRRLEEGQDSGEVKRS